MNALLRQPAQLVTRGLRTLAPVPLLRRGFAVSSIAESERPIGVAAALAAAAHGQSYPAKPQLFEEFSLTERVAVVSGANRGLGLEMALALAEAGARVYAMDLPPTPGEEFRAVQSYVKSFGTGAKLEYVEGGVDVTDQEKVWNAVAKIGDNDGRVDVGVAAAGILHGAPALEYKADDFQKVNECPAQYTTRLTHYSGHEREYQRGAIHSASSGTTDGAFQASREHHPDRINERKHHKQGKQDLSAARERRMA